MNAEAITGNSDISVRGVPAACILTTYHTHVPSHSSPIITNRTIVAAFIVFLSSVYRFFHIRPSPRSPPSLSSFPRSLLQVLPRFPLFRVRFLLSPFRGFVFPFLFLPEHMSRQCKINNNSLHFKNSLPGQPHQNREIFRDSFRLEQVCGTIIW